MKRFSLVSLACAAALAICPVVLVAQNYDFAFTDPSNGDYATGSLVTGASVGGGGYDVIAGSITLVTAAGSETLSLVPGSGISPGSFSYDNILYPLGNSPGGGGYLTSENYGLLFNDGTDDVVELNLFSNEPNGFSFGSYFGPGNTYGLWTETSGKGFGPTEDTGTFTLTAVPEGGAALLYMLLAGGACFGAVFFISQTRLAYLTMA